MNDDDGLKIADKLGFRWDGCQQWLGMPPAWVFTHPGEGFTIYCPPESSLEHVAARMSAKFVN